MALFEELSDFSSPTDAFAKADAKIKNCFELLSTFLSACQRDAPYLASWLLFPISMFDAGAAYHEVSGYCDNHGKRHLFASAFAGSVIRQLQHPTYFLDIPEKMESDSPIDTANELLAEAYLSLFRGMPRLTVLNAYAATESFANVVFFNSKVAKLVSNNVPDDLARELVEDERQRHKTEPKFLFDKGMKSASGRSLLDENKSHYDKLNEIQQLRHKVAHSGYKPTHAEALEAHRCCCEATRWLATVGGFPVKPMQPDASSANPGFSMAFKDANSVSEGQIAALKHFFQGKDQSS